MNDPCTWARHYRKIEGSNGEGKNEIISQFTSLQPHFYVKYKTWEYN